MTEANVIYEEKARMLMAKASNLGPDQEAFIDLATIMAGIKILKELIGMYKECQRPPAVAAAHMRNPGLFGRLKLRQTIDVSELPPGMNKHRMVVAVLETGRTMTGDEVSQMYES